jgi:hypothetical protein
LEVEGVSSEDVEGAFEGEGEIEHDERRADQRVSEVHRSVEAASDEPASGQGWGHQVSDEDEATAGGERIEDAASEDVLLWAEDVTEGAEAGDDIVGVLVMEVEDISSSEGDGDARFLIEEGAGLVEHTLGEIDADEALGAQGAQGAEASARAAASVEGCADGRAAGEGLDDLIQEHLWGPKRCEFKLLGEQIVASGGLRQGLLGELDERGAVGMKHFGGSLLQQMKR